jgi:acyl carrier protein
MERQEIQEIVVEKVKSLVETLPEEYKFVVNENTKLFGKNANIDSLSLVSIIVDIETCFNEEYGIDVSLTDDTAMTRKTNPVESVTSLVDYIFEFINK